jgi:hypothetical protein
MSACDTKCLGEILADWALCLSGKVRMQNLTDSTSEFAFCLYVFQYEDFYHR